MFTSQSTTGLVTPSGLNHLVLNVRNLERSNQFWTEIAGFRQAGELKKTPGRPNPARLRFDSGDRGRHMNRKESGAPAAVLDHSANGAGWLAYKLAPFDVALKPGQFVLGRSTSAHFV